MRWGNEWRRRFGILELEVWDLGVWQVSVSYRIVFDPIRYRYWSRSAAPQNRYDMEGWLRSL
eukprot:scaffold1618_cov158-Ochromonas_danica.AAC.22